MKRKLLSMLLGVTMLFSMGGSLVSADELLPNGVYETADGITKGNMDVTLEIVEFDPVLIATVPVEFPIVVDTKGNVTMSQYQQMQKL